MTPVIYVIDDDNSFRSAMARLLHATGYEAVTFESPIDFLASELTTGPACILLDVRFPSMSGIELQSRLMELGRAIPIIFLTGHGDVATSVKAMKAGAVDFLLKPVSKTELLNAIDSALARHKVTLKDDAWRGRAAALLDSLTPREREVFARVSQGWLSKQVAHDMQITVRTVKAHRQKVMSKLHVHSLAELVAMHERLASELGERIDAAVSETMTMSRPSKELEFV